MSNKSIQYQIKMHNRNQELTFESAFYIKPNVDYTDILQQMIEELKKYNLEFDSSDLCLILANNKNPRETYVILEKV